MVCLDGGCGDFERLWLSSSMRGALNAELRLQPADAEPPTSRDEVIRAAQLLLGRAVDPRTGRVRDFGARAFYGSELVPQPRREEVQTAVGVLGVAVYTDYPYLDGAEQPDARAALYKYAATTRTLGSPTVRVETILNRTWRPALETAVMPAADSGTEVVVALEARLPPHVDAKRAGAALRAVLTEDGAPSGVRHVAVEVTRSANGWSAPPHTEWLAASVARASVAVFGEGKAACVGGRGAAVPSVGMLRAAFPEAELLILGATGPPDAGGDNVRTTLCLPYARRLSCCLAVLLADQGAVPAWLGACAGDPRAAKRRKASTQSLVDCCGPLESVFEMLSKRK